VWCFLLGCLVGVEQDFPVAFPVAKGPSVKVMFLTSQLPSPRLSASWPPLPRDSQVLPLVLGQESLVIKGDPKTASSWFNHSLCLSVLEAQIPMFLPGIESKERNEKV
jgi:hypothetical protein